MAVRDRALLELLYSCGARISEAISLDVDDIDLGTRTARVLGKGRKERTVPFGVPAADALRHWQQQLAGLGARTELFGGPFLARLSLYEPGASRSAEEDSFVAAVRAAERCRANGVLVGCFRPPSVPGAVARRVTSGDPGHDPGERLDRASDPSRFAAPIVVANAAHAQEIEEQLGDALHRAGRRVKVIEHCTHMLADAVDVAAVESGVPGGPGGRGGRRACGDEAVGVVGRNVVLSHEELHGGGGPLDQGGIVAQQVGEGRCLV